MVRKVAAGRVGMVAVAVRDGLVAVWVAEGAVLAAAALPCRLHKTCSLYTRNACSVQSAVRTTIRR